MRASADQVRDATMSAVDVARGHASDLVTSGAEVLVATIDKGAGRLEDGIERVVDLAPAVAVEVAPRGRRRRWPILVVAGVILGGILVLRRRRSGSVPASAPGAASTSSPDGPVRYAVKPAEGGGWDVTGPDDGEVASHHDTQALGVEQATALAARGGGGQVVIHAVDGHVRDTRNIAPGD